MVISIEGGEGDPVVAHVTAVDATDRWVDVSTPMMLLDSETELQALQRRRRRELVGESTTAPVIVDRG